MSSNKTHAKKKKKQVICEPFESNFTSYATAAGEML